MLSEFRDRLDESDRADQLLAVMVDRLAAVGLVKRRGPQRTDSTYVLAAVRKLSRIELVGETMRVALEAIADVDEGWLSALLTSEWAQRYGQPVGYQRVPNSGAATAEYVLQVGEDGMSLLQAIYREDCPPVLKRLAEVEVLRQVWVQQYIFDHNGQLCWRQAKASKARKSRNGTLRLGARERDPDAEAAMVPWSSVEIVIPHDPAARFSHKAGKMSRVGYKETGTPKPSPARKALPAHRGDPPPWTASQVFLSYLDEPTAGPAQFAYSAPETSTAKAATSCCYHGHYTRSKPEAGRNSKHPNGRNATPYASAAKQPSPKPFARTDFAAAAIAD